MVDDIIDVLTTILYVIVLLIAILTGGIFMVAIVAWMILNMF